MSAAKRKPRVLKPADPARCRRCGRVWIDGERPPATEACPKPAKGRKLDGCVLAPVRVAYRVNVGTTAYVVACFSAAEALDKVRRGRSPHGMRVRPATPDEVHATDKVGILTALHEYEPRTR